ncbi:MAG: hypothetical protein IJX38_02475 [Clostridia bacterium]|nr:hypothetical protein [Clostridia bacterium]
MICQNEKRLRRFRGRKENVMMEHLGCLGFMSLVAAVAAAAVLLICLV